MFGWLKKPKSLRDYLSETKKVKINGVLFLIKRIDTLDFLKGYSVLMTTYSTYDEKKKVEKVSESSEKLKKLFRDIIVAGVVKPQLTIKDNETDKIHVNDVLADLDLTQKLAAAIITYSKKNTV